MIIWGMKNVLLISVLLTFMVTIRGAEALTVENVSISETGGLTVSSEAQATGTEGADAEVRSVIRTEGSNTRVRIDVKTTVDGEQNTTSVEKVLPTTGRLNVKAGTDLRTGEIAGEADGQAELDIEASATSSSLLFDRIANFLSRIFKFVFFFWE